MDWDTYKELSHEPRYFTRWAIDHTNQFLSETQAESFTIQPESAPLVKPEGHKGGPETDVLELRLNLSLVSQVLSVLHEAKSHAVNDSPSTQKILRGLIQKWVEYRDTFEARD